MRMAWMGFSGANSVSSDSSRDSNAPSVTMIILSLSDAKAERAKSAARLQSALPWVASILRNTVCRAATEAGP